MILNKKLGINDDFYQKLVDYTDLNQYYLIIIDILYRKLLLIILANKWLYLSEGGG